jgi:hypothetical protein
MQQELKGVDRVQNKNRFLVGTATSLIFFTLICWNLLPNGLDTPYLGVTVSASPQQLLNVLGFSDSGNYLRGAIDLQDLQVSTDNRWIFNLWPPGQMLLLALIISFGFPPVFTLIIVFTMLWSIVGAAIVLKALQGKFWYLVFPCFSILWFTDSPFVGWNQSEGAIGTDGIGTAVLCLLFVYFSVLWNKIQLGASFNPWISGFVVAASLSFLSHLRIIFLFCIVSSLILILFRKIAGLGYARLNPSQRPNRNLDALGVQSIQKSKLLLVILILFSVSLVPFTVYKYQKTGSFSWSNSDYQWAQRWMTDAYLLKNSAGFLVEGGANWACEIDPVKCREIQKSELLAENPYSGFNRYDYSEFRNLAFVSIVNNPLDFLENRISFVGKSFTSDAGAPVGSNGNFFRGIIFLVMYLYLVVRGIRRFLHLNDFELFTLFMMVGLLAPLFVAHFETRYLIPVQAMTLVVFTFYASNFLKPVKSNKR